MREILQKRPTETTERSVGARRLKSSVRPSPVMDHVAVLQRSIGNRSVERLFRSGLLRAKLKIGGQNDILDQDEGLSMQRKATVEESQESPGKESDCSGWQRDPQSISKVAAEHYVVTELGLLSRIGAGLVKSIRCDTSPLYCREPDGIAACDVMFANGLMITVTIYPDKIECWHPKSPLCLYDYTCPSSGGLVLRKRQCF